jgi:hypothetical protein
VEPLASRATIADAARLDNQTTLSAAATPVNYGGENLTIGQRCAFRVVSIGG